MLTIDEIKNVSFRNIGRSNKGYNTEDVDEFVDEVIETFEQLKKEKKNLVHKIDVLATRVEQYRADEETVRNALLASQKVADACVKEAKDKAAKIEREAESKAQAMLAEANKMTAMQKDNYLRLQSDAVDLRGQLIEIYKQHIKTIDDLPTSVDIEEVKKSLDRKYPTQELPDEESQDISSESQQEETVAEEAPAVTTDAETDGAPAPKHSNKFAHLKFGDNYDVSAD